MGGRPAVVVAFGSNLGQRDRYIREAAEQIASFLSDFRLSEIIETLPVGLGTEDNPPYLNAVGVGESDLSPRDILERLRAIEDEAGRVRPHANAPRTLDLDLILAGDAVVNDRDLQVPHPRFRDRRFVLGPLVELEPDLRDPATGRTMRELLSQLAD
jgi:2-amino-4-hydroxy-6-hydroxymethyldihydropteridine diphosphokinase